MKKASGGGAPTSLKCFKCEHMGHCALVCIIIKCSKCGKLGHHANDYNNMFQLWRTRSCQYSVPESEESLIRWKGLLFEWSEDLWVQ